MPGQPSKAKLQTRRSRSLGLGKLCLVTTAHAEDDTWDREEERIERMAWKKCPRRRLKSFQKRRVLLKNVTLYENTAGARFPKCPQMSISGKLMAADVASVTGLPIEAHPAMLDLLLQAHPCLHWELSPSIYAQGPIAPHTDRLVHC